VGESDGSRLLSGALQFFTLLVLLYGALVVLKHETRDVLNVASFKRGVARVGKE